MKSGSKTLIGRTLRVDIPELGLKKFYAKTDTGAYRSSLHCEYIKEIEKDGQKILEFQPVDNSKKICYYREYSIQGVLSSSGEREMRYCVDLEIVAKGVSVTSPVTLSNRTNLTVDLLLGRTFLTGNFIIDTTLAAEPTIVGIKKT